MDTRNSRRVTSMSSKAVEKISFFIEIKIEHTAAKHYVDYPNACASGCYLQITSNIYTIRPPSPEPKYRTADRRALEGRFNLLWQKHP
ncbi:hypothetical protein EVAR_37413_1 [Eumeta japonica]|uniref:Uncharacterized protein n=1 Tax=Eumeta variegata TaxID=151549 RepID=A0A4C1WER8_EUMVA|nr:hypothetical protein EVAR_37413_1 [Eumeta japonica]